MQICVLEWICSGGLGRTNLSSLSPSLLAEGWAMLYCLCQQFTSAGHRVTTIADERVICNQRLNRLSTVSKTLISLPSLLEESNSSSDLSNDPFDGEMLGVKSPKASFESLIHLWKKQALQCDLTIIVAPEIDGTLEACVAEMCEANVRMINCTGQLLQASCDKWLTAQRLHQYRIEHPMTWTLEEFSMDFLGTAECWCSKPRLGAGCEGLRKYSSDQLSQQISQGLIGSDHIIQLWKEGRPFSCSAVVDFSGNVSWLPLVTQEFQSINSGGRYQEFQYQGASSVSTDLQLVRPIELLNSSIQALSEDFKLEARGWISLDLVLDEIGNWTVIEVNSRLTTSAIELCQQGGVKLAPLMLSGYNDG